MPLLLRSLSRKRVYATFPWTSQIAPGAFPTTTKLLPTDMSAITSIPHLKLLDLDEDLDATPPSPICIDAAIQHPYRARGEVIAVGVPLEPLKDTAPTLLEYLTTEGTGIVLPHSEAIDWNLLLNLIDVIVDKHCSGDVFEIDTHEALQDPVKAIKLHVVLQLFGLSHQVDSFGKQLQGVFETRTLTLTDVFWMYGALVPPKDVKWMPEMTEWYLYMMARKILNADREGRLHPDVRTFFLEDEGEPYHLTRLLEVHFIKYRSEYETDAVELARRPRRDTLIERSSLNVSPGDASNPASTSASTYGRIFPNR